MNDEKDDWRWKIEAFFDGKRPALRHAGKNQLVKKAAQESDMHKKQADRAGKPIDDSRVAGEIVNKERRGGDQEIHGVDTGHAIFEVLFEPVFAEMEIIVIPEGDQKAGQHKEDGYPDMKF